MAAPPRAPDGLKVLIVSPVAFAPDWEGNRKRVRQIVELFGDAGAELHFLFVRHTDGDGARMAAELHGRYAEMPDPRREGFSQPWYFRMRLARFTGRHGFHNFDVDSWHSAAIDRRVAEIVAAQGIELVVCEYIFYSRALTGLAGVTTVIDTHDVFADRYRVLVELGRPPDWFSTPPRGERKALRRADFVLAIQQHDAAVFRGYGHTRVHTLPYLPSLAADAGIAPAEADPQAPVRLCFVGSDNDVNVAALESYLRDVHPALLAAGLDVECVAIGAVCKRFTDPASRSTAKLRWLGRVDHLDAELAQCDVLVNSVATGTGLPVKVLDALAAGLHVFASPGGVRGLPLLERLGAVQVLTRDAEWVAATRALAERKRSGAPLRQTACADMALLRSEVARAQSEFLHCVFAKVEQRRADRR